jgi:nucleoid-associated protein YgaU
MNLANQYYGDKNLWWVIARANNQSESIYTKPGKEYRVPRNTNLILKEFEELNR